MAQLQSSSVTGSLIVSGALEVLGVFSGSIESAATASYVNPLNQDVEITGSLNLTSGINAGGTIITDSEASFRTNGITNNTYSRLGIFNFSGWQSGTQTAYFNGWNQQSYINSPLNIGLASSDMPARLRVRGSGTTSSTTTFRLENSATSASLLVDDAGDVYIPSGSIYGDTTNPFVQLTNVGGAVLGYGTSTLVNGGSLQFVSAGTIRFRVGSNGLTGVNTATFNNSVGFAVNQQYSSFENSSNHITIKPGTGVYYNSDFNFVSQDFANRGSTSGDTVRATISATGDISGSRFYTVVNDTSGNIRASYDSLFLNNENETSFRSRMQAFNTNPIRNNYHFQATSGSADTNVFYVKDTGKTYIKEDLTVGNGLVVTGSLITDGDLTVTGTVTAQEFKTEFVSASIIYRSGSTKFGDTPDDVHQFTGSTHIQSGSYKVDTYGEGIRWYDGTNYSTNRIQLSSAQNMQLQVGGVIQLQSSTQIVNGRYLTFNNSGNTTRFDINNAGGTDEYRLEFSSGSTQLMVISGSGNVGIGVTNPTERLHITGSVKIEGGTLLLNNGDNSVYIGDGTGLNDDKTNNYNVGVGPGALADVTSGTGNIAIGRNALADVTTGGENVAVGAYAAYKITTYTGTTAVGGSSQQYGITGQRNTSLGYRSLHFNETGDDNVTIGYSAQYSASVDDVVMIGYAAGEENVGSHSVGIGYQALRNNTAFYAVGIGKEAAQNNTGTGQPVFIGWRSGINNTGNNNTAIGASSLHSNSGTNITVLGKSTGYNNTGDYLDGVGFSVGFNNNGDHVIGMGYQAVYNNEGTGVVGIGREALSNNSSSYNTALGYQAGYESDTALSNVKNTFLGYKASYGTSGSIINSTAVGAEVTLTDSNTVILGNNASVGIGTTAPSEKLEVYNNGGDVSVKIHEAAGTHEARLHLRRGGSDWELVNHNDFSIEGEGGKRLTIKAGTGNVGIGTTSPAHLLDVSGSAFVKDSLYLGDSNTLALRNSTSALEVYASNQYQLSLKFSGNNNYLQLGAFSANYGSISYKGQNNLYLGASGQVGVGVLPTTTSQRFLVSGSANQWGVVSLRGMTDALSPTSYYYGSGNAHNFTLPILASNNISIFDGASAISESGYRIGNNDGVLNIGHVKAGTTVDSTVFNISGSSVGVGTTSPGSALEVAGTIYQDAEAGIDNYFRTNHSQRSSQVVLNPGILVYGNGTQSSNSNYGMDLGYDSDLVKYRTRIFTSPTQDISFGKLIAPATSQSDFTEQVTIKGPTGNVGIGTTSPAEKLTVEGNISGSGNLVVEGSIEGASKSFNIPHPTLEGKRLIYGSLEGPEHGVYARGKVEGNTIELPDYWVNLVDEDTITVQLTSIGKHQNLYVKDIKDNKVFIGNGNLLSSSIKAFYFIQAMRKDIDKLQTVR